MTTQATIAKTANAPSQPKPETALKKLDIFHEFVLWSALPPEERGKLGMENQTEFVAHYKINKETPTRWKSRPDFVAQVTELRRQWAFDKTGSVINGIYVAALKGNPFSQKLWLQYFLGFNETSEVKVTNKVEITMNDIRFLIEALPEPLKSKHYANIRELLSDSRANSDARNINTATLGEDYDIGGISGADRPEDTLPDYSNNDAQRLPSLRTNGMASCDQTSVRADMENRRTGAACQSSSHHQGTARGW